MADTPAALRRRTLLALPLLALARGALAAGPKVVTILGDSITAGLGLPAAEALPAQLHLALTRLGLANVVRGAGVSGDTTAGGAARVDFSVQPDTAVAVVALGGNDLLQGVPPRAMRANLKGILDKLKARHIPAMLAGVRAPPAMGADYAREFDAVVPDLARAEHTPAFPDLLGRVALDRALNQGDGIHPNPQGARQVAARLAPAVAAALKPPP